MATWRSIGTAGVRLANSNAANKDFRAALALDALPPGALTARAYTITGPSDGTLTQRYTPASYTETLTLSNGGSASSNAVYDAVTVDPNPTGPSGALKGRLTVRTNKGAQRVQRFDTLTNLTAAGVKFFV